MYALLSKVMVKNGHFPTVLSVHFLAAHHTGVWYLYSCVASLVGMLLGNIPLTISDICVMKNAQSYPSVAKVIRAAQ